MLSTVVSPLSDADRFSSSLSKPVGKDLCKNVKVFIVDFLLQYVSLSKRFVPEVVSFLGGILFLASKKQSPTRKYQPTPRAFQWNNVLWWKRFLSLLLVLKTSLFSSRLKQTNITWFPPSPHLLIEKKGINILFYFSQLNLYSHLSTVANGEIFLNFNRIQGQYWKFLLRRTVKFVFGIFSDCCFVFHGNVSL